MKPLIWMEVRCGGFSLLGDEWGAYKCEETIACKFSSNISSVHSEAKRLGAKIVDGEYLCPNCYKTYIATRKVE